MRRIFVKVALVFAVAVVAQGAEKGTMPLHRMPDIHLKLGGYVGTRINANVDGWLKVAPKNNPGLLDMFARRDSGEAINLVPWAGEFVGKYLISAVQASRMSDDPALEQAIESVVDRLLKLQAEDGYLGPWPKKDRLRGQWDLWGHYHVMLGLLLWSEYSGDERAMVAAKRIADLVCSTFLDTDVRVLNAGSPEMNMGIIHGMARLARMTGNPRYLRMAMEVLKDFESAGDYYHTGLAGEEFFRTPRPRWESLHSLQGMTELYRITGDETFRTAFLNHWASIRRFDYRNTGGFSSGEAASGNPYPNSGIETCCVVAWQEVMMDALQLTGNATIADDLEQTTFNAMLGAQHPSGAWCTYNTSMAGSRHPSHHEIAFQARPDAPHLNCCSVNGPRGHGCISRWGVMRNDKGLVLNYYGPMTATAHLADGTAVIIRQETDYPVGGRIEIFVEPAAAQRFALALRIPAWSGSTSVHLNGKAVRNVAPGTYLSLKRKWKKEDKITLQLDMGLRYDAGDREQIGKASLYRGPILLAWDNRFQKRDRSLLVDVSKLDQSERRPMDDEIMSLAGEYPPWMVVDVPTTDGATIRLIDFASAGASTIKGRPISAYETWLPADGLRPPRPVGWLPLNGASVPSGPVAFTWRAPAVDTADARQHTILISDSPDFEKILLQSAPVKGRWLLLSAENSAKLKPEKPYYWKLIAENENGRAESLPPCKRFMIDPAAPRSHPDLYGPRESDGIIVEASLSGKTEPLYGVLLSAAGWKPCPGPEGQAGGGVELDGNGGMIKYRLLTFPDQDYTLSIHASVTRFPKIGLGQIFSAWCAGMDDPLRLTVQDKKLFARIEAGYFFGTEGVALGTNAWHHIAAVKGGRKLTLYVDGQATASVDVPPSVASDTRDFALGGNPHFSSAESLAVKVSGLKFYARALSVEEIRQLGAAHAGKESP